MIWKSLGGMNPAKMDMSFFGRAKRQRILSPQKELHVNAANIKQMERVES